MKTKFHFLIAFTLMIIVAGTASAADIIVNPGDSIQAAINGANTDDTIIINPGTYTENVDVNKSLIIISQSGNPDDTIVQAAASNDHVFNVTADNVTISGFNVTGATNDSYAGIYLDEVQHNNISNNIVSNNWHSIWLDDSSNNTLSNNTVSNSRNGIILADSNNNTLNNNNASNNDDGIDLEFSDNNTLNNNTALNNNVTGILIDASNENILTNNNASSNKDDGFLLENSNNNTLNNNTANSNNRDGIRLEGSDNNLLNNNNAFNNGETGIYLRTSSNNNMLSNNTASNNDDIGIFLAGSNNTTLNNNTADSNTIDGIWLLGSSNNTLNNNTADLNTIDGIHLEFSNDNLLNTNNANSNNEDGISLVDSNNNTLISNVMCNNSVSGIRLFNSDNNTIYNNYFNNTDNAQISAISTGNVWNTTKTAGPNIVGGPYIGGNYWAKPDGTGFSQTCEDMDLDGFCDLQYDIDGNNTDFLPLTGIIVEVDVNPRYSQNYLHFNDTKTLEVAILGSEDFDVRDIHLESITITSEYSGADVKPVDYEFRIIGSYESLVVEFDSQELITELGLLDHLGKKVDLFVEGNLKEEICNEKLPFRGGDFILVYQPSDAQAVPIVNPFLLVGILGIALVLFMRREMK